MDAWAFGPLPATRAGDQPGRGWPEADEQPAGYLDTTPAVADVEKTDNASGTGGARAWSVPEAMLASWGLNTVHEPGVAAIQARAGAARQRALGYSQ